MKPVKNVVLVHGAWANGSCWAKLIPQLEASGLHVVAVQSPLSSIAEDVAATRRMIDAQDGPVLLVGHSYGGAVITEAGNNDKVVGLVYVAAFAPDEGETLGGMAKKYPTAPLFGELQPIEDGFLLLTAKGVKEDFAQDLSDEEQRLLLATQAATQAALLSTPIKAAAWHKKPKLVRHRGERPRDLARAGEEHGQAHERQDAELADEPRADAVAAEEGGRLRHRSGDVARRLGVAARRSGSAAAACVGKPMRTP